jgi:hypothetical protein
VHWCRCVARIKTHKIKMLAKIAQCSHIRSASPAATYPPASRA